MEKINDDIILDVIFAISAQIECALRRDYAFSTFYGDVFLPDFDFLIDGTANG